MTHYQLIIIGGGPTGINCGIAAQKAGLDYLVLEKGMLVNSIYNFPTNMTFFSTSKNLEIADIPFISHYEKPTRLEALEYYRRLVHHFDLRIKYQQKVTSLRKKGQLFYLETRESKFTADNIVLATGFYDTPRKLSAKGADLPKVKHYYDDPHPYIDRNLLVIGGANSACDVALETWSHGAKVTMAIRKPTLYPKVKYWIKPNIENRIKEGSITAYFDTEIIEIKEKSVTLKTPDGLLEIENDLVLAMIGYRPDYSLLDELGIDYSDREALVPKYDEVTLETNVSGVYVAGVLNAGLRTSSLFIENTRDHGDKIVEAILAGDNR